MLLCILVTSKNVWKLVSACHIVRLGCVWSWGEEIAVKVTLLLEWLHPWRIAVWNDKLSAPTSVSDTHRNANPSQGRLPQASYYLLLLKWNYNTISAYPSFIHYCQAYCYDNAGYFKMSKKHSAIPHKWGLWNVIAFLMCR